MRNKIICLAAACVALAALASTALAQTTAFTYQGQLDSGGAVATGLFDVRFSLFSVSSGGSAVAGPLTNSGVLVSNGIFTITMDLGAATFDGSVRWLEVGVRTNGNGTFTTLAPRQQITATPYAIRAANFGGAIADSQLSANVARLNGSQTFIGDLTASRGTSTNGLTRTFTLEGVRSANVNDSARVDFRNFDADGSGTEYTAARIAMRNTGTDDGELRFSTAANGALFERMTLNNVGHVGIGTNAPSARLHVNGADAVTGLIQSSSPVGTWLDLRNTAGGTNWQFISTGSGNGEGAGKLLFTYGPAPGSVAGTPLALTPAGNVGLGTHSPVARLDVNGGIHANGPVRLAETPVYLRGGTDNNHGVAYCGPGSLFAGVNVNGPVMFGWNGGGLGTRQNATENLALKWDASGNLTAGGELSVVAVNITSDRNAKENFKSVNPKEVLEKVSALPISEWQYKTQGERHIGPMAQDFHAAFGVGQDERHITTVDADGVALAAIQGLHALVREREEEATRLRAENSSLAARLAAIERTLGLDKNR